MNLEIPYQIEQAILSGRKDKLYGILLCLYSGLRIGELIALQWSDIDFTKGILTVSKSCHDGKAGLIIDEPKTATSRRVILGQNRIPTKIAAGSNGKLQNGDNVFYIMLENENGDLAEVYTLTIYRSYAVTVSYYNHKDVLVYSDTAYTGTGGNSYFIQ